MRMRFDGRLTHIRAVGWGVESVASVLGEDFGGSVEDGLEAGDGAEAGFVADTA